MPHAVSSARADVLAAIQLAGQRTGADFSYLMKVAEKESSLDPTAKAATSSAAGLFQFIEQTWLGAVKEHGGAHGLGAYANDIVEEDGRLVVKDAARRKEILDLRFEPNAAASIAGSWANENKGRLESLVGRAVSAGELYAAHFLGVGGAAKLLQAPLQANAADLFPAAAKANPAIFYDDGKARSVAGVIGRLVKGFEGGAAPKAEQAPRIAAASPTVPRFEASPMEMTAPAETETLEVIATRIATTSGDAGRSTFDGAPRKTGFGLIASMLPPSALAALQALDPTRLRGRDGR